MPYSSTCILPYYNTCILPYNRIYICQHSSTTIALMPNCTMTYKTLPKQIKPYLIILYYTIWYNKVTCILPFSRTCLLPYYNNCILPYIRIYIFQHSSTTISYNAKPYNDRWNFTKPKQALLNHTILTNMI